MMRNTLLTKTNDHPAAGMSLFEMVVVLAILAAVFAGALVSFSRPHPQQGLRITVAQLASQLRAARARAIAKNRNIAFAFNAQKRRYRIESIGAVHKLPAGLELTLTTARRFARSTNNARMLFYPDGSSSGGTLTLSTRHTKISIDVDWLTGAVKLKETAQ